MTRKRTAAPRLDALPARDRKSGCLHVVVETMRGSRTKLAYDPRLNALVVKRVLPEGMSFPFDFGFVPSTLEDDGDPMDALVLLDAAVSTPCVVLCRLVGIIEAKESDESGKLVENARLVTVAEASLLFAEVMRLSDLPDGIVDQITSFFISYNQQDGKRFEVLACHGPRVAAKRLEKSRKRVRRRRD